MHDESKTRSGSGEWGTGPDPRRVSGIIYGPVRSRRFGLSLGINLSGPGKHCSFSCPYCFRGPNDGRPGGTAWAQDLPTPAEVRAALTEAALDPVNGAAGDWTVAGNAEPTDHPRFPEIIDIVLELRDRLAPQAVVSVLSNGMGLVPRYCCRHQEVAEALARVDRPCLKLDAGTQTTWRRLAGAAMGVTLEEWLEAAGAVRAPILQILLVQGLIDTTTEPELAALERCIRRLGARRVQVVTADRPPADTRIRPVPAAELQPLAARLEAAAAQAAGSSSSTLQTTSQPGGESSSEPLSSRIRP